MTTRRAWPFLWQKAARLSCLNRSGSFMVRSVLVTGGAGHIGSHACKALARAGISAGDL